jgi:hypothetical protein
MSRIEGRNWLMARYTFAVSTGAESGRLEHSVELKDDAAALACACDLARDLIRSDMGADPAWRVIVATEKRTIVFTVPLLAACA